MPISVPSIPVVPDEQRTPLVDTLLAVIFAQQTQITEQQAQLDQQKEQINKLRDQIQALKDEIARLKGHKQKPKIKPSNLEPKKNKQQQDNKQPGSTKRKKTAELKIHKTVIIPPKEKIPEGSENKGYADYTVVGLRFESYNVCYRLQIWKTPDGRTLKGELPAHLQVLGGHFSLELVCYIQHQYYHGLVPQNVILEQLLDVDVDISEGQINRILIEQKDGFHEEKEDLLRVGLHVSPYIHVDDTGARHNGRNGYCTHIGNAWFAYFVSTQSKSRINFLEILRAGHTDYVLDAYALEYMRSQKLPKKLLCKLEAVLNANGDIVCSDKASFDNQLQHLGKIRKRHAKIITEGALLASVVSHEINPNLAVISDDAGQFNVLVHALCWIHAERLLAKLIGVNDDQRTALEAKRTEVWDLYRCLKLYKENPNPALKQELSERFDIIFQDKTCFTTLNHALERLHRNKAELLLVLERPDIPLHNNLSENDVREYVTRRKRNGSTRSDLGRRARDTFASLKKTCRKLGISFWRYLLDRNSGSHTIPPLSDLVIQKAKEANLKS